jgi:hypothetical protein
VIEFKTVDGDRVYVSKDKVVMVTGAKTQNPTGGAPVNAIGVSMVYLMGGVVPLAVQGGPDEVSMHVEVSDGARDRLLSA